MVHVAAAAYEPWDAIVVGSGAGGSSIAFQLAKHGARVLVIERGDFLQADNSDAPYRLRESDFRATEHENGISPAWPIGYADIAPYYRRAEEIYRVHGSLVGDPREPPHGSPCPSIPHHPVVARVVERLERAGIPVTSAPLGFECGPQFDSCATGDVHHCGIEARMNAEIAALRRALARRNLELLANTECLRVETSSDGRRATAVIIRNAEGTRRIAADAIVISAGIPETASILRRSRTDRHPGGLGNAGGALGRFHSGHSVGYVFPLVSMRKLPPPYSKTLAINACHDDQEDAPGIIQMIGQMPFWAEAPAFVRPFFRAIGKRSLACVYATEALPGWRSGVVFRGDEIVAKIEPAHNLGAFERLRERAMDAFRRAGYPVLARRRMPYLWHDAGTACFGTDPVSSVCDPDCQVHGVARLYVADQSVLPSAGCVNTTLTVIALALRTGDHIASASLQKTGDRPSAQRRPDDVVDLARAG